MLDEAGVTTDAEMRAEVEALHPMERFGTAEETADAVLWLASDDASFVERERTPARAIQVGIRCHLAGISLKYCSKFFDSLGVSRSRVAVHNWVHSADLQPLSSVTADQLALDKKMT